MTIQDHQFFLRCYTLKSNHRPDKSIIHSNFHAGNLQHRVPLFASHVLNRKSVIPWRSSPRSEVIELTNQVRLRTLCNPLSATPSTYPQRVTTTSAAGLLLLRLCPPVRSDNSPCEMHRAQKSAYASSVDQGMARQLKPAPFLLFP